MNISFNNIQTGRSLVYESQSNEPINKENLTQKEDKTFSNNDIKSNNSVTKELTEEEKMIIEELKKIDQEVRAHEAAHLGAAGGYALGGAQFQYQRGQTINNMLFQEK